MLPDPQHCLAVEVTKDQYFDIPVSGSFVLFLRLPKTLDFFIPSAVRWTILVCQKGGIKEMRTFPTNRK
jgi:hypothetical protein